MSNPIDKAIMQITGGYTGYPDEVALMEVVCESAEKVEGAPGRYMSKTVLAAGIILGSSWISPGMFRNNIGAYWREHCQAPEEDGPMTIDEAIGVMHGIRGHCRNTHFLDLKVCMEADARDAFGGAVDDRTPQQLLAAGVLLVAEARDPAGLQSAFESYYQQHCQPPEPEQGHPPEWCGECGVKPSTDTCEVWHRHHLCKQHADEWEEKWGSKYSIATVKRTPYTGPQPTPPGSEWKRWNVLEEDVRVCPACTNAARVHFRHMASNIVLVDVAEAQYRVTIVPPKLPSGHDGHALIIEQRVEQE